MRHRRALELPFQESASVPAPRQAPSPRSGEPLRPVISRADTPAAAPAQLWLAVHLGAPPSQPLRQDLERLGVRAQRLTPRVSLDPPDGLLLEVKGSLHLFGGVEGLSREMAAECSHLRMPCTLALAPTPLAALALARARRKLGVPASLLTVTDPAQLVGKLSPLPLATLRWPQDTLDRLARIGVRTIGEALRLPRAGFARRFGTAQLQTLDRLTGRASDLKDRFEERARFRRRRELIYELESHAALLAVLEPLLEELGRFLEARQCGVLTLECRLRHRAVPPTRCVLRLAAPLADPTQLAALLGERLSALVLPEPVRACELRSGPLVPRVLASGRLWQPGEHGGGAAPQAPELLERLRTRLGAEAVHGLGIVEDHRPEAAWKAREPAIATPRIQSGLRIDPVRSAGRSENDNAALFDRRPLWLLPVPRQLSERDGLPRRRGPLRLLGEAERIEAGWWDGAEIARDYYTALDVRGARLWVFRERAAPHRWFLHGVFG
ncbi:MAG TPA: DNA polymerase Y family protein [Steroidobacteraceae bacterium]|nr:DNA polymerase Y family protein [Steroidobacteraceae bacterium]